jgi:hypothetical protein
LNRTTLKSLDIQLTPSPAEESSTMPQQLRTGKRSAGLVADGMDQNAIRLLQGHKTEVRMMSEIIAHVAHVACRSSFVRGILPKQTC